MKITLIIMLLGISSISFGQVNWISSSRTWLYDFSKSADYISEWTVPYESYTVKKKKARYYSIYYANNGNWQFVGTILLGGMSSSKVYFKSNYQVAYGIEDEKPREITLKTKQWKVE